MARLGALACLVMILSATGAATAASSCQLRFDVLPEETNLTFEGYSTYSIIDGQFPITMMDPTVHVGLAGAMYAALAGPCPAINSQSAWIAAASRFILTSAPNPYVYQPLDVFPATLEAGVFGLPLNFSSLQMNLTLAASAAAGSAAAGGRPGEVPMTMSAVITSGWAFSNTSFTGGAKLDLMRNHSYTGPTTATVALVIEANATYLQLSFPSFNTSFSGSSSGTSLDSTGAVGIIHYSLNGTLVMRARLGCPSYCGDHGRCVRTAGGALGCECECGWEVDPSSGQCQVPSGFCPAFPETSGSNRTQVVSAAPAPRGCSNSNVLAALRGTCPSGYGYDVKSQNCNKCVLGFSGPSCNTCQTDLACQDSTSIRGATCATGLAITQRTRTKHYSCAPSSADIVKVVGPTLAFTCSTVGPGSSRDGSKGNAAPASTTTLVNGPQLAANSPYCDIELRLGNMPPNQTATCTGWGCHFAPNQASFFCDQTVCTCPNGCKADGQNYEDTFKGVSGKFTFECQEDGTSCALVVGSLNVRIDVSCDASECQDPSGPILVDSPLPQQPNRRWVNPLVAAIPAMLLYLGASLCGALMAAHLKYLRPGARVRAKGAAGPVAEGLDANAANGLSPVRRPAVSSDDVLSSNQADTDLTCLPHINGPSAEDAQLKGGQSTAVHQLLGGQANVSCLSIEAVTVRVRTGGGSMHRLRKSRGAGRGSGDVESLPGQADGWRTILHGVSGTARSGSLLGVMGPSGGGKSTLLNVLSGMLAHNPTTWAVSGTVTLDNTPAAPSQLARVTALVPQDDCLLRSLTVEECLLYSAALRLDPALGPGAVRERVDGVVAALGIGGIRASTVWSGGGAQGVSGGERRRVSIGMELVSDAPVLILDEPTSGLDSFAALQLMRQLHSIAATGRIVVLSLHQPGPLLFGLLDSAMLLAAGHLVYYGPPAGAEASMAALGAPCPAGLPVAEHMLHVCADPQVFALVLPRVQQRQQQGYQQQQTRQLQQQQVGKDAHVINSSAGSDASSTSNSTINGSPSAGHHAHQHTTQLSRHNQQLGSMHRLPLGRQIGVLFWRSLADIVRNPALALVHSLTGLILGLLVGVIFLHVSNDTAGAQNRVGAIFFALCVLAFTSVTSLDLVQSERRVAARELRRGYYSPSAYVLTKLVLDGVLLRALPALLFALPFYFLMGLQANAASFFTFMFVFVAFNAAVGALALGFATLFSSAGKTILTILMVLLLGLLFAGFLANKSSIPAALRWICYLSVFRYAWEALVINELSNLFLFFTAPNVKITVAVSGETFLEIIGVDAGMLLTDISVLVALYVACAAFPVAMMWLKYGRRTRARR